VTVLEVGLSSGQSGTLASFDGRVLAVVSPVAFAPGAPVQLTVRWADRPPSRIEGRSMGSRRRPAGDFDVRIRPVNLRRQVREALVAAFDGAR
jgi:hypothetical protein